MTLRTAPVPLLTSQSTRIIVDSSSNVPVELQQRYRMLEVPALVNFGTQSFRNNVDISTAEFYERFAHSPVVPTTSQPPPKLYVDAYQQLFAEGAEHIVAFAITSKLSGTFSSSQMAAREFGEERFTLVDTTFFSIASGWQAIRAARMIERGITQDELRRQLDRVRSKTFAMIALETLKYAALSGRVSNLQAGLGDILQIKPILEAREGKVESAGRVRGRKKSMQELIERSKAQVGNRPIRLGIANANCAEDAAELANEARRVLNIQELHIVDIGPAIAALAGPGALALMGYPIEIEG